MYKVQLTKGEYPFIWNMRAIKACNEALGKSFEQAIEEDYLSAYSIACFEGIKSGLKEEGKEIDFDSEEILDYITQETLGQITSIFASEVKKYTEAVGMRKKK